MTRVLIQPSRGGLSSEPVLIVPPWAWWEARTHNPGDGVLFGVQDCGDGEYALTFGHDGDAVTLTDPPAVYLMGMTHCDVRIYNSNPVATPRRSYLTARVVWHESPGPHWQRMRGLVSCHAGDYRCEEFATYDEVATYGDNPQWGRTEPFGDLAAAIRPAMRFLNWPVVPTIREDIELQEAAERAEALLEASGVQLQPWQRHQLQQIISNGDGSWRLSDREALARVRLQPWPVVRPAFEPPTSPPMFAPKRPKPWAAAVLPESEVVDEIDRLVNAQVAHGPVDDYDMDRYPKCEDCPHNWHGLECEWITCDCINTAWLKS